ncbi:MAG: quinoprotein dehydrogenase-associated SoxYZ-like carrier [Sphingomonadales bacterium]|nr:quinoprotein dehydrogenase-associated SoxYZ-like carrier [Sphingomonadales bacterium]MDE2570589.1 quinoprotein dehydrogenase-associated SoxYZ-like carrier [Sphingomonadales bacterium]
MRALPALSFLTQLAAAAPAPAASALVQDPLGSPMWQFHRRRLFGEAPVVFDGGVKVRFPMIAEDQHVFPVEVDARALAGVTRMIVLADLDPIPYPLDYRPLHAEPFVATRIKLDQRTPVRGAALAADGTWHLSGGWVDAAGGGCSAPPASRVKGDWAQHLGEMRGIRRPAGAGATRLRIAIRHPMDTGLVDGIPAYNLETLTVTDTKGVSLADLGIAGSVSEDPAFTLIVGAPASEALTVTARDSNGLVFRGTLAADPGATGGGQGS